MVKIFKFFTIIRGDFLMKKFLIILMILLALPSGIFAADVSATLPGLPAGYSYPAGAQADLDLIAGLAELELAKFSGMDKAAEAFGNAASYAADGANQRNLMGYKFLSIAVGTMIGFQSPFSYVDNIKDFVSRMEKNGDLYFGAGLQAFSVSVGLNSDFFLDGLFISAKIGKFSVDTDDLKYDSFNFGLLARYQLVDSFSVGVVKWRGLQVGSGFIYYNSTSDMSFKVGEQVTPVTITPGINTNIVLDPSLNVKISSSGLKIPLDIMTGVRVLWITNLNFGLGADLNLASKSEIELSSRGETTLRGGSIDTSLITPGSVNITFDESSARVDFIKLKAMLGIGFSLGPVKLDIPFTYYFDGTGFASNLGITGAVTL